MSPFSAALYLLCGLPRSGKSTLAMEMRLRNALTVVCPDEVRVALHGRSFYAPAEPFVWATCETMTRSLLRTEHAVVIDATNTTKQRRAPWLEIAGEFGIEPMAVVLDTPEAECQRRNALTVPALPSAVISRMAERWEAPTPEEGLLLFGVEDGRLVPMKDRG